MFDAFELPEEGLIHLYKVKEQWPNEKIWNEYLTSNIVKAYMDIQNYVAAYNLLIIWLNNNHSETPHDNLKTNYHNLGLCYKERDQLDSALIFQKKSLELEFIENDSIGIATSYMEIGNTLYEQYFDDSAHVYFKLAYNLAKKVNDIDLMKYTTFNMAVVEENAGNIDSALIYRKEYDGIRDSLDSRDRLWKVAKEEKEFAVRLKDDQIALIEKEKAAKARLLAVEKRERNVLLIATLSLVLLLGIILLLYRRSVKKKHIIEQQRLKLDALNTTKNEILSIVAHDLKSPVHHMVINNKTLLNNFNQKNQPENSKDLLESNSELGTRTFQLIDNLLNWALNQNDQFFFSKESINLNKTIDQVAYNFQPLFDQKKNNV